MPKRKRTRLTLQRTKKRTTPNLDPGVDPTCPTVAEWNGMKQYRSFVVRDAEEESHSFPVHNYALIIPSDMQPDDPLDLHEHWVGKMKEIRSRGDDPSEVWVKVQWLWSAKDISEQKNKFDPKLYGKMERFLSNMYDFVHSSCFQGLAHVVSYDESDLEQPPISDETFYYRYRYDFSTHEIIPTPTATCICGVPYNPDAPSAMHFCPRSTCAKAFHAPCLATWAAKNRKPKQHARARQVAPRALQLERTQPDASVEESQQSVEPRPMMVVSSAHAAGVHPAPPKRPRGRPRKDGKPPQSRGRASSSGGGPDRRARIPRALLALARSPMVKGAGAGVPRAEGGVAGNIAPVARARQIVADVVGRGGSVPDDWEEMLGLPEEGAGAVVEAWVVPDEELLCPSCGGAI